MPKINLITAESAPLTTQSYFAKGQPGPIVSSLAHVPDLLPSALPFISTALNPIGLDLRTKEIVILRTSVLQACQYCVATHTVVAHRAGLSKEEILSLHQKGHSTFLTDPKEVGILRWTDEVGNDAQDIQKSQIEPLKAVCTEAEIVELTLLIGATIMLNRYATALSLPISTANQQYNEKWGLTWNP